MPRHPDPTVLFFCQQAINLQGFIKENLLTRCSIPRRRAQDCRTGPADSRSRRMSPRHRRRLLHSKGSHPRHRSTGPPPRRLPPLRLNHNHHYPILPRSSTSPSSARRSTPRLSPSPVRQYVDEGDIIKIKKEEMQGEGQRPH